MILLALLLLVAAPQGTPPTAVGNATSAKSEHSAADLKLHVDVLTLLEVSGIRKKMDDAAPLAIDDAIPAMKRQCPKCTAEFYTEYEKHMLARNTTALCMSATATIYEKYLSDDDVLALTAFQKSQSAGKPVPMSDALKAKLGTIAPQMMPELMGKCGEIGAKNGMEVGAEITREHPEYVNGTAGSGKS